MADSGASQEDDIIREAERIIAAAQRVGVILKLAGGAAVYVSSPSARAAPLRREYRDLDFVAPSRQRAAVGRLLERLGYRPDLPFNTLNGHRRLLYWDARHGRQVDVFLDQIRMCHTIDLRARLDLPGMCLAPADLLLTKMQIVEMNWKDLLDVIALLLDHPVAEGDTETINRTYIAALAAQDWGLYRTLQLNTGRVLRGLSEVAVAAEPLKRRLEALWHVIDVQRKPLAWRLRARLGDRIRWYEVPEEADHSR